MRGKQKNEEIWRGTHLEAPKSQSQIDMFSHQNTAPIDVIFQCFFGMLYFWHENLFQETKQEDFLRELEGS